MKIKLSLAITVVLLSLNLTSAFAAEPFAFPKWATRSAELLQRQASQSATLQQRRLAEIIKHADNFIENRIATLNNLNSRIQNDTRLTDAEKSTLSGQVQAAISGLNALKATIDADTTVEAALADGKQIFSNFRVYAVLEPQLRLLIMLNNIQSMVTKVQNLVPQLQNLVNTLQSQGKDISQLTPLIADINSQLQTISTTITNDITTVQGVTPATSDPQAIFKQVRNDIKNVIKTDFGKVRQDLNQMRQIFHQLIRPEIQPILTPTPISTPTPTPTPEPTVSPTP